MLKPESDDSVGPLKPAGRRGSPSRWTWLIDALRRIIGLKPLYLAERWADAKVRQEEATADAKLLAAKADYERVMAESQKLLAEADVEHSRAELNRATAMLLLLRGQSAGDSRLDAVRVLDVRSTIEVDPK